MQYKAVAIDLTFLWLCLWRIPVTEINSLIYEGGPEVVNRNEFKRGVYSLNEVQTGQLTKSLYVV